MVERGRVPLEHRAEAEQLLANADDCSGYIVWTAYALLRVVDAAATGAGIAVEGIVTSPTTKEQHLLDFLGQEIKPQPA